ncbi:MAG: hypothetical protein DRJ67_03600, partial [Thermoprotei archaeon]
MAKKVFLRGIDEKLYAEVKARAAILGITVSEAVNRALETWLRTPTSDVVGEVSGERLREAARRLSRGRDRGVLVVANDGELHAWFDSLEEAVEWLRELHRRGVLRNSLIKPLGGERVRYLEVG